MGDPVDFNLLHERWQRARACALLDRHAHGQEDDEKYAAFAAEAEASSAGLGLDGEEGGAAEAASAVEAQAKPKGGQAAKPAGK